MSSKQLNKQMKSESKHIENEVKKTLELLENHGKIKTRPFFNTRLQAKIEKLETEAGTTWAFFRKRVVQPVLISTFIILNLVVFSFLFFSNSSQEISRKNDIYNMIDVYEMDHSEYYFITENNK